ncbi:Ig-like domain-containing protein [Flavobacterium sp. FlaQc-47]|uniref:Ig-like domain-containing protein n=1 Tax=Flavobacterium sp. FlaQc-47 TaxID=3374180 RepID=UPI0037563033
MKKTLLLLLFLPFFGFSQIDLVKWNAANANTSSPTYSAANITSQDLSANNGITIAYTSYSSSDTFFQTSSWPTPADNGGEYNPSKYIQFTIKPNTGYKADLSTFTFQVRSGSGKFRVKYSKDASFATGVKDLILETTTPSSWTTYSANFSAEINPVLPSEIVYVRIYSYSTYNTFDVKTGTDTNNIVPVIRGTISTFDSSKVLAINDYVSTLKELAVNINPLNNDVKKETVTALTISNPAASEGTAIINPDKTITFNPAQGFTGTSTFNYTITAPTGTSTASIKVTISNATDDNLSLWNGSSSSFNPITSTYVNSNSPVTSTGASLGYVYENTTSAFFQTGNWPDPSQNGGNLDLNKYIQFKINPADANHQLNLKQFNFSYRGSTNGQRFEVRYSKDVNFATGVKVLVPQTNSVASWTAVSTTFATDINPVLPNETVYIRFYVSNTYNTFDILNGNGNSVGPVITGTVKDINTLTANNDYVTLPGGQSTVIPIITNDIIGGSALQQITVTQPTNGTVTVNGTTSVTFTPSSSFAGTTSFNYTLRNAASNYSSGTVGVTAACTAALTAGTNYWKGYVYNYTGNTPAATTYAGSVAEKANFDRNIADGVITGDATVAADAFCSTAPSDKFFVRYLMKATTTAETYNITLGADDGVRLYIDGTLVNVTPANSWSDHSYVGYSAQYTFTAGTHDFVLEYYENAGSSRVSFSYGAVKGNPTVYGDNKWNVYGYTLADISLPAASYAGTYVDNNLNINTQTFWDRTKSPSYTAGWQGAPMNIDQFAITYKRQGFPCGRYQIQLVNCDDIGEIYIDGVKVYTQSGYTNASVLINSGQQYSLNKNSKIDVRLREDAGDANLAINFIDVPFSYDGSTAPPANSSIIINNNYTLTNDLEVCSCTVAAGKTLTIATDKVLTVNENITVNATGKIVVQNSGSLVQTNNSSTYTGSTTSFEVNRNTTPINRFDYTYWSSPVINQTLYNLSPNTLFDKYLEYDASANDWKYLNGGNYVMQPGKGYIIRGPQSYAAIGNPQIYQGKFIGVPNNGIITTPVTNKAGNATTTNLLGNPYPSALNADQFYADNSGVIKGTFYLWTHSITPVPNANGQFVYSDSSYISYNATGSTGAGDFTNCPTCGGNKLTGNIASGQGFFVEAKTTGNVVFNNALRVKTTASNNQFSKTAKTVVEKNRVWLNLKNNDGAYNEMLLGYITGATNELDDAYDGDSYASGTALYSILGENNLVIQGRALPFEEQKEIIPLGYIASSATEYTIGIESVDGLFSSKNVYLLDKTNNVVTNLSESRYTFATEPGTFNDRFVLSFYKKATIAPNEEPKPADPVTTEPSTPVVTEPETPVVTQPETPVATQPETPVATQPETPVATQPETPVATQPENHVATQPETPVATQPETPVATQPETPGATQPENPVAAQPETPVVTPENPVATQPESPVVTQPESPVTTTPGGNPTPENPTLEVPGIPEITKKEIIIYQSNNQIMIESDLLNIESVYVYDVLGRNIFNKENVHTTSYSTDQLSIQHQVIIVKVRTEDNKIITKKVIF